MASSLQHVWLIRHGETAWSRTGQHTGWSDIPLLPESESALRALQPRLRAQTFAAVFSSPLQRARHTAELVGLTAVELDADLREWNYGEYEGKTKDQIRAGVPGWNLWTHGVRGGETLEEVAARAQRVVARVRAIQGNVALVAHGHILRIVAACWLDLSPLMAEHFALSTGSISILTYENDIPAMAEWNWRPSPCPLPTGERD